MACALLALLAGQVHGHSCNLGYETDSIPCMGTFYVSTAKAGGNADIWLSADSTSGLEQALVSRNNVFKAKMQNDGNFVVYRINGHLPSRRFGMLTRMLALHGA
jgi:hypothetical protein